MFLELNIDSSVGETLLLSSETFINSISICNTGSVDFKLSMYKRKQNDTSIYFYLKDVTIRQQNIFLGEDIAVATGDTFYISIDSGNCSVIVDYK